MLRLILLFVFCGVLVIVVSHSALAQCNSQGKARWPVKTSAISTANNDAHVVSAQDFIQAPDLDITSNDAPNDSFIQLAVQIGSDTLHEGDLVLIRGYLSDVRCEAGDGDYHGDLRADDSGSGPCAEVEVPYPPNISDDYTRGHVQGVRDTFDQWLGQTQTAHVTLIGQLFFDATHNGTSSGDPGGGRGKGRCAATLWEVHPVVKMFMLQ